MMALVLYFPANRSDAEPRNRLAEALEPGALPVSIEPARSNGDE